MSIKGHYITYLLKLSILEIEAILGETDIQKGEQVKLGIWQRCHESVCDGNDGL